MRRFRSARDSMWIVWRVDRFCLRACSQYAGFSCVDMYFSENRDRAINRIPRLILSCD